MMTKRLWATVVLFAALVAFAAASMTNSKLSIHTSMLGTNSWDVINQGLPRVVKLLDSFGDATQIKANDPGVVIVGRIYLPYQPMGGDANQTALDWWNQNSGTILQYPDVDYWEGYNEPAVGDADSMSWYAAFDAKRVEILAQNGLKAAIGSFSVGVPDVTTAATVEAYYPAIDAAIANNGVLGVHEYAAPLLNATFSGSVETGSGWLTGRYRMLYNEYLIPTNRVIPLVITENGIDGGTCAVTGCNIAGGWQNFCSYWAGNGFGSDCNAAYLSQLSWYDSVMRNDDYVIGSTIFCLEIYGWADFDITPMVPDFIQYLQNNM